MSDSDPDAMSEKMKYATYDISSSAIAHRIKYMQKARVPILFFSKIGAFGDEIFFLTPEGKKILESRQPDIDRVLRVFNLISALVQVKRDIDEMNETISGCDYDARWIMDVVNGEAESD